MLIDDDEVYLSMGREILEDKYTVYPVESGRQAFVILEKIVPDIILLDINMPDMDGYEVIKRLKTDDVTKNIPVIFLTAHPEPGYEYDGLQLGAVDYVIKPFAPLLLIQRIENQLLISSQSKRLLHINENLENLVEEQTKEIKKLKEAVYYTVSELEEIIRCSGAAFDPAIIDLFKTVTDKFAAIADYRDVKK
ncbi:MAG: response regulator [Treponema sp.]|nr:response regulator [Treponema sp.]